jgi:hypothetical protein
MSTDTATKRPDETSEMGDEGQRGLAPLLFAALMARREESGGSIHPLLLAALASKPGYGASAPPPIDPLLIAAIASKPGYGTPQPPIDPLLIAALVSQRTSGGEPGIPPAVLMPMMLKAFAGHGRGSEEAVNPLVFAALAHAR